MTFNVHSSDDDGVESQVPGEQDDGYTSNKVQCLLLANRKDQTEVMARDKSVAHFGYRHFSNFFRGSISQFFHFINLNLKINFPEKRTKPKQDPKVEKGSA